MNQVDERDTFIQLSTNYIICVHLCNCAQRNVEIKPNRNWGGEGSLGCELATGLLHRITRASS